MSAPRLKIRTEPEILLPLIRPGSTVVDIGSGQGTFISPFLDSGCTAISVEPYRRSYQFQSVRFKDFIDAGRCFLYHTACSETAEQRVLSINDDIGGAISSFDPRWTEQYFVDAYSKGKQEQHQLQRLDTLLAPHLALLQQSFGLLKIDAEGFDVKVLRGYLDGINTPPLPDFIMFEVVTSSQDWSLAEECVERVRLAGFDRFRMIINYSTERLADSGWLTYRELSEFPYASLNNDHFGRGASSRLANIIATTSFSLAEGETRELRAKRALLQEHQSR